MTKTCISTSWFGFTSSSLSKRIPFGITNDNKPSVWQQSFSCSVFFFALLLVSNWTIYFRFVATEKCNMQSNGCGWLAALLNRTRPLSKRSATEVKHMHIGKLLPRAYNNIHVIPIKQLHFFVFGCIFCCCWFENERKKWTRGWKENFIVHYSVHSSVWNSVAKSNEIPSAQLKPS